MTNPNEPSQNVPDQQFFELLRAITGLENVTETELTKPILRKTIENTYILYIIQYALLSVFGVVANCWTIYYISKHKLYRDNTHALFINLSICHFVQSAFVVPVTLVTTIVHNWILGTFMCYFVPMLQVSTGDEGCYLFLDIPYILSVWERCVSMVDWKCAFSRMRPVNMIFLFSVMETIFGCKWASDVTVERVLCINMWWWMKNSTFFAAKKPLVQWQKNVYSTQKWSNHQVILRVVYSIYGNPQYFFSIGYAIGHKSSNFYELTAEPRDNRLMLFLSLVTLTRQ